MSLSFSFRSCLYPARLELDDAGHRLLVAGTRRREPRVVHVSETRVKVNCTPAVACPRIAQNRTWSVFSSLLQPLREPGRNEPDTIDACRMADIHRFRYLPETKLIVSLDKEHSLCPVGVNICQASPQIL